MRIKAEGACRDSRTGPGASGRLDKQVLAFTIAVSILTKHSDGSAVLVAGHIPLKELMFV